MKSILLSLYVLEMQLTITIRNQWFSGFLNVKSGENILNVNSNAY